VCSNYIADGVNLAGKIRRIETGAGLVKSEACIIFEINRAKENVKMKKVVMVICVLVFLAGLVWFLQGINVLPGSFMTGDPQWAINGGIMMVVSGGVFWFVRRK
jgi:hypothetical protein